MSSLVSSSLISQRIDHGKATARARPQIPTDQSTAKQGRYKMNDGPMCHMSRGRYSETTSYYFLFPFKKVFHVKTQNPIDLSFFLLLSTVLIIFSRSLPSISKIKSKARRLNNHRQCNESHDEVPTQNSVCVIPSSLITVPYSVLSIDRISHGRCRTNYSKHPRRLPLFPNHISATMDDQRRGDAPRRVRRSNQRHFNAQSHTRNVCDM